MVVCVDWSRDHVVCHPQLTCQGPDESRIGPTKVYKGTHPADAAKKKGGAKGGEGGCKPVFANNVNPYLYN